MLNESYSTPTSLDKGNTELLEKINASIKNLKDSGKLQEIIDSYISAE